MILALCLIAAHLLSQVVTVLMTPPTIKATEVIDLRDISVVMAVTEEIGLIELTGLRRLSELNDQRKRGLIGMGLDPLLHQLVLHSLRKSLWEK